MMLKGLRVEKKRGKLFDCDYPMESIIHPGFFEQLGPAVDLKEMADYAGLTILGNSYMVSRMLRIQYTADLTFWRHLFGRRQCGTCTGEDHFHRLEERTYPRNKTLLEEFPCQKEGYPVEKDITWKILLITNCFN